MTVLIGTLSSGMHQVACASSEQIAALSGVEVVKTSTGAFAMVAPHRQARKWSLSMEGAAPHEMAALQHLWRYGWASLPWAFVSETAAGVNGLTPSQSAFRVALPAGVDGVDGVQVLDRHGRYTPVRAAQITTGGAWEMPGPLTPVAGKLPVTVSAAFREGSGQQSKPALGVQFFAKDGSLLSETLTPSPAGYSIIPDDLVLTDDLLLWETGGAVGPLDLPPLVRRWQTYTAPWNAVACRMVIQGGAQVIAPAVTLTSEVAEWGEGDGAPEVVPTGDLSSSPTMTVPGYSRGGWQFELEEVGLALR